MLFVRDMEIFKTIFNELSSISEFLNEEKNWSKRALCRDINGEQLNDPQDPRATSWCILGACHKINASADTFAYLDFAAKQSGFTDISRLNDFCSWDEFLFFYLQCLKLISKPTLLKEKK